MKRYKLVIFDLDGTLADTSPGILECHRHTNAAMGRPIVDEAILEGVIGGPLLKTYVERFGYSEDVAKRAVQIYREHYAQVGYCESGLYPGMVDCLAALKKQGYLLAVATFKAEDLAKRLLNLLGVEHYFDVIHGMDAQDTLSKKDLLDLCMNELGVSQAETILVGDSQHDANGAAQAGIDFLGVSYGFGFTKTEKAPVIYVADSCADIKAWLTA